MFKRTIKHLLLFSFIVLIIFLVIGCSETEKEENNNQNDQKETLYKVNYDLNGGFLTSDTDFLDKEVKNGEKIEFNQELFDKLSSFEYLFPPVNQEVDCLEINGSKYYKGSSFVVNSDITVKLIYKPLDGYHYVTYDLNGGTYYDSEFETVDSLKKVDLYELSYKIVAPENKMWDGAIIDDVRYYVGDSVEITKDCTCKYMWKDIMTLADFEYEEIDNELILTSVKDTSVKVIQVPNGVTKIGDFAFSECKDLKSVIFPDSVKDFGEFIFYECQELKYVSLPEKLTKITDGLFSGCTALYYVSIPLTLKEIGDYAFSGCSALSKIRIPNGIENIGDYVFSGCDNIEYNEVEGGLYFGTSNNPTLIFIRPVSQEITEFTLDSNTLYIHTDAFKGCSKLVNVNLPLTLKAIGSSSFEGCSLLNNIIIPDTVISLGSYAFKNCTSLSEIVIPESIKVLELGVFSYCSNLTKVTLPEALDTVGVSAFFDCKSLSEITLPENLVEIGDMAFSGCTSLKNITIPSNVSNIQIYTFSGCTSLESITLSDNLTSIAFFAFEDCTSLKSIELPSTITTIAHDAFSNCTSLKGIKYNGTKEEWESVEKGKNWVINEDELVFVFVDERE